MREFSPPPNVSHVTCHVSRVTFHVSCVTFHVSHVTFFFFLFSDKGVELIGGGSVINGVTPSSFYSISKKIPHTGDKASLSHPKDLKNLKSLHIGLWEGGKKTVKGVRNTNNLRILLSKAKFAILQPFLVKISNLRPLSYVTFPIGF